MGTKHTTPKTTLLTIRISEYEKALIRKISAQYGQGMSEVIRMLIVQESEWIKEVDRYTGAK